MALTGSGEGVDLGVAVDARDIRHTVPIRRQSVNINKPRRKAGDAAAVDRNSY